MHNREDNVSKGLKNLSDQDTYRKLDKDITNEVAEKVVYKTCIVMGL